VIGCESKQKLNGLQPMS